eukprot:s2776_g10.t1
MKAGILLSKAAKKGKETAQDGPQVQMKCDGAGKIKIDDPGANFAVKTYAYSDASPAMQDVTMVQGGQHQGFIEIEPAVLDDIELAPVESGLLEIESPPEDTESGVPVTAASLCPVQLDDSDALALALDEDKPSKWKPGANVGQYVSRRRGCIVAQSCTLK